MILLSQGKLLLRFMAAAAQLSWRFDRDRTAFSRGASQIQWEGSGSTPKRRKVFRISSAASKTFALSLLIGSLDVFAKEASVADFFVSPDGSDGYSGILAQSNNGKTDGPFKTLQRARDSVRKKIKTGGSEIVVMLRGGRYLLTETVCFGLQDSGKDGQRVIYRNYPNEEPILTPAVEITGWEQATEDIAGLPEEAKGRIWIAQLTPGMKPFDALYQGNRRLTRAVSKGFQALKDKDDPAISKTTLYYPSGVVFKNWDNISDVELIVRPTFDWTMSIVPLESVDTKNKTATVSVPATYPIAKLYNSRMEDANNVWVENAVEFLDRPGEWVLNTKQNKLYFWPLDGKRPEGVVAPQLTVLVKLEGNIDYDGPDDVPVRNITFRGLTFTQANRYSWQKDHIGWGLQHDWEMFDKPTAMLRFRGAESCSIENCRFVNSAAAAIRLDLYCQNNTIHNNLIEDIGGVGILLAGYGPGSKDVNKCNRVTNNSLHDIGQIYWQSPAIFVWQSGENLVAHNLLNDSPYTGIVVDGRIVWDRKGGSECSKTIRWKEVDKIIDSSDRDIALLDFKNWSKREPFLHARRNIIERNEIRGVMQKLCDGNGIYVSGAGKENIIRLNYVHDCRSIWMREGIRCDDDQYETSIERNIVYNNGGAAVGIVVKGKNNIINNIIVDLITGDPSYDSHYYSLQVYPADGAIIQRNIIYSEDKSQRPCEIRGGWYHTGPLPQWKMTNTDYNCYFNTEDPDWLNAHFREVRRFGVEIHSVFADPMFEDLANGDFRLMPNSPALKLGVEQIDVKEAGLTRDFPREVLTGGSTFTK